MTEKSLENFPTDTDNEGDYEYKAKHSPTRRQGGRSEISRKKIQPKREKADKYAPKKVQYDIVPPQCPVQKEEHRRKMHRGNDTDEYRERVQQSVSG
jgi:hypothetical protein